MTETEKKPVGRPLKFESVEDLETRIELYFQHCEKEFDTRRFAHDEQKEMDGDGKEVCSHCWKRIPSKGCILVEGELKERDIPTVLGLALWLDTTRQTLLEYQGEVEGRERDPRFADSIKRAKQRIEGGVEQRFLKNKLQAANGIFWLTNNGDGWVNKQNTDIKVATDGAAELAAKMLGEAGKTE